MNPELSIQSTLESILTAAAERLRATDFPSDMVEGVHRLAQQVREPFVLAIVGMVKAGKSSLVNTLLGDDLAKVGATETTATVNWFRYGTPDHDRPVRCYRRGQAEPESHSRSFLDRLQGDDEETLRLGSDIERIEYLVESKWLRSVILVDTPGLGAVSDEHQNRTAEFIRLNTMLRQRHHEETRRLALEADAILYVQPPPLRGSDRSFLEEFQGMLRQGTSSFNAIAVIGKFDSFDENLENGQSRATTLAGKIGRSVKTVLPVSVGVHRLVERYRQTNSDYADFFNFVRATDDDLFLLLTDSHNDFISFEDCLLAPDLLAPERRAELVGESPWASFRAAAMYARKYRDRPSAELLDELERLAGFSELRSLIDRTFVARGALLRCYRVVQNAESIFEDAGYEHVESCRSADAAAKVLEARFLTVLKRLAPAALPQDQATVEELAAFVRRHSGQSSRSGQVHDVLNELLPRFAEMRRELEIWSEDITSLQTLADHKSLFSAAEIEELEALFGNSGWELHSRIRHAPEPQMFVRSRQTHWHESSQLETQPVRRQISASAAARYAHLLYGLRVAQEPFEKGRQ